MRKKISVVVILLISISVLCPNTSWTGLLGDFGVCESKSDCKNAFYKLKSRLSENRVMLIALCQRKNTDQVCYVYNDYHLSTVKNFRSALPAYLLPKCRCKEAPRVITIMQDGTVYDFDDKKAYKWDSFWE